MYFKVNRHIVCDFMLFMISRLYLIVAKRMLYNKYCTKIGHLF